MSELHDPDCPMTNSTLEHRTGCVCDDMQWEPNRVVPEGGIFAELAGPCDIPGCLQALCPQHICSADPIEDEMRRLAGGTLL